MQCCAYIDSFLFSFFFASFEKASTSLMAFKHARYAYADDASSSILRAAAQVIAASWDIQVSDASCKRFRFAEGAPIL